MKEHTYSRSSSTVTSSGNLDPGVCHPSVPILRLTRSSEVSIPGTRNPNQNSVIMFQTGHWSTATPLFDIVLQHRYNNPKSHPYLVEISRM